MDKVKNVHRSGALAAILNQGKLQPVDTSTPHKEANAIDNSLIELNVNDCSPWKYANRLTGDMGNIDDLAASLKNEGQQEPILVRPSPPNSNKSVKYEVIFGRRRYEAAKKANIKLLAICKELSDQDAIIAQKAENTNRKNLSPYSEAKHYELLLMDGCFKNELELSTTLGIPKSTFYDLMSFTKLPDFLIKEIPNIHKLSINMAVTLLNLINKNEKNLGKILSIAPDLGESINSAKKINMAIKGSSIADSAKNDEFEEINFIDNSGTKYFSIKKTKNGLPIIRFTSSLKNKVNSNELFEVIQNFIKKKINE